MKNQKIAWVVIAVIVVAIVGYWYYAGNSTMPEENSENINVVSEYMDIGPKEAKALIDNNPDLIIIDVSPDYDKGHLPGSVNYYLGDGSLDDAIPTLEKDATYLVYCHFESASRAGAQKLVDAGFTNVYRLDGDYSAWVAFGYDVEK